MNNYRSAIALCLVAGGCLCLWGCGSDGPEMVPVEGRITLEGGSWPAEGIIYFTPVEPAEGLPRKPGEAHFDTDGNFSASTRNPGDGLIPGTYRIAVECWEVPPSHDATGEHPGKSYVAEKYSSPAKSGLELKIPKGSDPIEVTYDVQRAQR
jgi:hypothetical protein